MPLTDGSSIQKSRRIYVRPRTDPQSAHYAPALGGILEQRDPSVCLSHGAAAYAIGTLAACSLAIAGYQRCADCGPVRGRT